MVEVEASVEELVVALADDKLLDYLLDSDAVEQIVDWAHEDLGIAKPLLRTFFKLLAPHLLRQAEHFVRYRLDDGTRSVAVFARGGKQPEFLALEFEAALDNQLFVESTPVIFPLVELKDNYHRYVLMVCAEDFVKVLEVSLGAVTREMWARRPELRQRVGREWTQLHYQNHRRDRTARFVKEKIALLQRIVNEGAHTHLMLAGNPKLVARVRRALPKALEAKLVDVVPASLRDRNTDVVEATLSTFLENEEQESQAAVDLLRVELLRNGLAVAGYEASKQALEQDMADLLVVTSDVEPDQLASREELVRLAERAGIHVEVVQHSDTLMAIGGAGCLLRYRMTPALAAVSAA